MALILDTGPVYASLDRRDKDHKRCRELIESSPEVLVIPPSVLPEVDYLVSRRLGPGPMIALLRDIEAGAYVMAALAATDCMRIRELMDSYANMDLGFVDASVIALTEHLREPKVATLDHRHFSAVRPSHVKALQLLPS